MGRHGDRSAGDGPEAILPRHEGTLTPKPEVHACVRGGLIVKPPDGPVMVSVPVVSLSSSGPLVSSIVCAVAKTVLSNVMASFPPSVLAMSIA